MNFEMLATLDRRFRSAVRHLLECCYVLRSAVRIPTVVERVHPDIDVVSAQYLRPGKRERKEDCGACRHVRDRDSNAHLFDRATLGNGDVARKRRAPEQAKVDIHDDVLHCAYALSDPARGFELEYMTLPVSERQRIRLEPF